MKIVFNTDQIHLHGGIEKVMATKANYFAALPEVEVYVVTAEQKNLPPRYSLDSRIKLLDLGVDYDRTKSYFSIQNLKKAKLHYQKQKALFKSLKPDVIISPNFNFDHYWLPFIKGNAKLIKERHSSRYQEEEQRQSASFLKRLKYELSDWVERRYNHIVVLNVDEAQYVKTGNAAVIPNPVELSTLSADIHAKKVVAAGRISPVKNFGDLIKAWSFVKAEFPDWQLDIYGEDYLGTQATLESLIRENGLEDVINFKGSSEQMLEDMSKYSIYAMTSETECFPMVLLEALSTGLPVVSYDSPTGPRHILTDNSDSFVVPYKNLDIFTEKLRQLMANENLRKEMGGNAKINAQRFEISQIMRQWKFLFESLM